MRQHDDTTAARRDSQVVEDPSPGRLPVLPGALAVGLGPSPPFGSGGDASGSGGSLGQLMRATDDMSGARRAVVASMDGVANNLRNDSGGFELPCIELSCLMIGLHASTDSCVAEENGANVEVRIHTTTV